MTRNFTTLTTAYRLGLAWVLAVITGGCLTYQLPLHAVPPEVPAPARPVWLMYKAARDDDYRLFKAVLSKETREVTRLRVGMKEAFRAVEMPGPLEALQFDATRTSKTFPGRRLIEGYAFVRVTYGRQTGGTLVRFENGAWRVAFPNATPVDMILEPIPGYVEPSSTRTPQSGSTTSRRGK
jgi:hypothetical protein